MGRWRVLSSVLLDTHAWAWALLDEDRLTTSAKHKLEQANSIFVSTISLFEIGQKVRLGKWKQMQRHLQALPSLITESGARATSPGADVCLMAATLDWNHRDPFDRILAATAIHHGLAIVSADSVFDTLPRPGLTRIW